MRSRRVPVFRLGSRGPGGDARSLRLRSQASASVRKRWRRVGHPGGTKIVAKRRTVVTFYVSYNKSVNSHRDRGGRGRENCRHFRTRPVSSRLKSVNSHRDRGGRGRENCRHFWTRFASSRLKSVNSHRDRGGSWSRKLSSLLDSSRLFASQKCQQSQGSGGSWSRKLSSLLDSSRFFASQKCQQSQGSGGVVVAETVVTFGLVPSLRVSKVSTVTGIGGGRGRENCRHFWTRPVSSRLKSVNSHRDRGGRGRENCLLLDLPLERRKERGEKRREERREEESG